MHDTRRIVRTAELPIRCSIYSPGFYYAAWRNVIIHVSDIPPRIVDANGLFRTGSVFIYSNSRTAAAQRTFDFTATPLSFLIRFPADLVIRPIKSRPEYRWIRSSRCQPRFKASPCIPFSFPAGQLVTGETVGFPKLIGDAISSIDLLRWLRRCSFFEWALGSC